ncbi:hypothetical protein Btaycd_012660, partial [Bartonella taylorii]
MFKGHMRDAPFHAGMEGVIRKVQDEDLIHI